ncbi:phosphoglycolate phosphatase [Quisquiliibacterium transsilvanicum]|uniref:Phosphoglycolate phosphatase n=1 Tax=Quisquiliibacterium transsilvanicum TaxID=1549638 RepID=A0A7W8MAF8_9BURK|nr:phosphoglycolate phosphatase [Quisquiliibacterium transsilvanicum]
MHASSGLGPAVQTSVRKGQALRARAVILDLDGTLLDTAADLAAAVNAMLADAGRPTLPTARVAAYVGKGAAVLVHRALTDDPAGRAPEAEFEPAYRAFLEHYRVENGRHAVLYPGVLAGLDAMRAKGLRLAVVTNKPSVFIAPLLEQCGIAHYFELVVGGDSLPRRKPDPLPMLHVCEAFGLEPAQVVAIGDSLNDALAARAAGMPVLAVPYGYNEGHDVRSLDVDAIVSSLLEAAGLIEACA